MQKWKSVLDFDTYPNQTKVTLPRASVAISRTQLASGLQYISTQKEFEDVET